MVYNKLSDVFTVSNRNDHSINNNYNVQAQCNKLK